MTNTVANVRYVRCPSCLGLLTEPADVPVYKCGGCDTILRAKHGNTFRESISIESFGNKSQILSCSASFEHESKSLEKEARSHFSDEAEQTKLQNLHVADSDGVLDCKENGESSKYVKDGSTNGIAGPAHQLTYEREKITTLMQTGLLDSIHAKRELASDGELGKSLKLTEQDEGLFRLSNTVEESQDVSRQCVSSEDDLVGGHRHDNAVRSSNSTSTNAYKDSIGSSDNVNFVPRKYLGLSRRTFRSKTVLISAEREIAGNRDMANHSEALLQAQKHLAMLPNRSAVLDSCVANRDESSLNPENSILMHEKSFESEDFHSVQSWMESEKDSIPRSSGCLLLQKESLNHQNVGPCTKYQDAECDCFEVLKKVDDLRNHLNEFCDRMAKVEVRPRFKGSHLGDVELSSHNHKLKEQHPQYLNSFKANPSSQGNVPRNNVPLPPRSRLSQMTLPGHPKCSCMHYPGLCGPSIHNKMCPLPHTCDPLHDVDCGPHCCCHNTQMHEHELEKLHHEEKRQHAKRHCLPVSGGAPFVLCSKCLQLLQLPADFLVSKKRWHKLQCGGCNKSMVFSFRAKAGGLSQTPIEALHPNSEVSASTSCTSAQRELVSYAEEYGISLVKGYSAEEELLKSTPAHREGRRRRATASSLHRLMGYDSASDILFQDPGEII